MTEYAVMPKADYQNACNSIRAKTGAIEPLKSGDLSTAISSIQDIDAILNKTVTKSSSETATAIQPYFFQNCANLTDIYFPKVVSIDGRAFFGCSALTAVSSVNFPLLREFTGDQVFFNCTSLTTVDFPLLEAITPFAFQNCGALVSVNLPLLTEIPVQAFRTCAKLNNLHFPNVTSIGDYAFYLCRRLDTLILSSETPCEFTGTAKTFEETPIANGTGYIYVPAALIEDYKVMTNGVVYANQFRAKEDYPEICGGV